MSMEDFWNDRFGADTYAYGTEPNDFLRENVTLFPKGGRVLCIAEGEGRNGVFIAEQGHKVSAIDISKEGQAKTSRLAKERQVDIDYTLVSLDNFDFGLNRWDAIVSVFGYLGASTAHRREETYPNLKNALAPGGVLIVEAYHPKQLGYGTGGGSNPDGFIAVSEFDGIFTDEQIIIAKELERDVVEGEFHTGTAYVTQFIARK